MILDRFIVLEGIDGSGTSTQLSLLTEFFSEQQQQAFFTCEPTPAPTGKLIRRVLKGDVRMENGALALLFAADRREHLYGTEGILEAHKQGKWIICDRYLFSTLAYQSLECEMETLYDQNCRFPLPALTFFIDTPPEEADKRIDHRDENREIYEKLELQKEIRANYLKAFELFEKSGMERVTLNGNQTIGELQAKIREKIGLRSLV